MVHTASADLINHLESEDTPITLLAEVSQIWNYTPATFADSSQANASLGKERDLGRLGSLQLATSIKR